MRRRQYLQTALGAAASPLVVGCVEDDSPDPDRPPADSPLDADVTTTIAMRHLELPWDIEFADNGEVVLTERAGRVRRGDASVLTDGEATDPDELPVDVDAGDLPGFVSSWEAGAQGVALHPEYPDVPYVYLYYTVGERGEAEDHTNRVVRYDTTEDDPEIEILVDDILGSHIHNGGRIDFGPEGRLWVLAGTGGDQPQARDPATRGGVVMRIAPDGEPAGADIEDADPRVVTYGHRNPQAIDWLEDGTPIVAEHGPAQRDEIHLLEDGRDYGWPVARNGAEDPDYESYLDHDFAKPLASSGIDNTWAPSGGSVYDADAIPEWNGRFLLGGLVSHRLHAFTLLDDERRPPEDAAEVHDDLWLDDRVTAVRHELFTDEQGRIRHAEVGPDGEVYLLTSNTTGPIREEVEDEFPRDIDDVIVRIDPA